MGGVFDPQSGPTWVRDAKCNGDEPSIFNCDLKYVCNIGEVHGCDHTYDGGVICEGQEPGMNGKCRADYMSRAATLIRALLHG